jgi:tetratricopeptide (TPR) repeat protein
MIAPAIYRSRPLVVATILIVLAITGVTLNRVVAPAWQETRTRQPALRLDSSIAAAGQGITLALLGGFRALVADVVWLRMYVLWEQHDLPGTETLLRLVAAIDPRPLYFWINGARIVAYDLAAWRILDAGGYDHVPAPVMQRIVREQAQLALSYLDAAMAYHPANADLWVERGNIQLNRLGDLEAAAASYRKAWEQPNAPYYAARIHAELLRRMDRKAEALAWLVQVHPALPSGDASGADIVLERIRDLERELGVPPDRVYRPSQ